MAKQVMDVHVSKGMTTAQSNEHQRRRSAKGEAYAMSKGNYDPTRERLNFEVAKGGVVRPVDKTRSIPERIADNLRERGIKNPNEGLAEPKFRTVVNFIFGGSRERMHELAFGRQQVDFELGADNSAVSRDKAIEDWARDVYTFVSGKYGEENIAAFIVHLDELNPHIHCTLLPIQDGRFAYKKIFAGKDKYEYSERMKQLHSDFAEVNAKWGMERGTSVAESGARHRTTEQYRRELSAQCTDIERRIACHQATLAELQTAIRLAERRVKGLSSMVDNLKREQAEKERLLQALQRETKSQQGDTLYLRQKMTALEKELGVIQSKLSDKQEKLRTADRQLSDLNDELRTVQGQRDALRTEAVRYSRDIQNNVNILLNDVMLESLIGEQRQRAPLLSNAESVLFDGSLLQSVSERGQEVAHCAMLLFLGLVNDATTFAEGHGGGGGGSDMKWGRDKDEDDREWMRRCLMRAGKMMQPATGKKPKR